MNSDFTTAKRKTGGLIAKNLIILLVLVAVCALSIWAWFTKGTTATADGINVKSRADGVQVSWDGVNYYDNLQAIKDEEVVAGVNGLAKNLSGVDGEPLKLSLITGNGTNFFEPYLNRRTGTVLASDTKWSGINVDSTNSEGRYVDMELYFRGTTARDVYLAGDSKVLPKSDDNTVRTSEYGPFTKDYIAAASRVAFLTGEGDSQQCSFIWAPNADIELKDNENGYTKYTTTATEEIKTSAGSDGILNGGAVEDNNTYYLWTFTDDELIDTYTKGQNSSYLEARQFTYDSKIKYYVTELSFYVPTYEHKDPSIPIIINNSGNRNDLSSSDSVNIAGYDSLVGGKAQETNGQHFFVANGEFNLDNNSIKCTNKMYADSQYITSGEFITIKFGYNPETDLVTILNYEASGGGSFTLGGKEEEVTVTVTYFPLENNTNCALVNPASDTAVSSGEHYMKAVQFKDNSTKLNVLPVSVSTAEQFTAVKSGDGYAATYTFRNVGTNQYLTITNGTVSYSASGSSFSLYYMEGVEGPLLKSGDYFLVVKNGEVAAVKLGSLDAGEAVTVYTGSSYQLNTGLTADSQPYQYYTPETGLVTLSAGSTPKLFTSTNSTDASVKVGNTKIVSLEKATEDAEYYEAKIVIRVWVEGTDREAKTPLADGIFDMSLHFTSK